MMLSHETRTEPTNNRYFIIDFIKILLQSHFSSYIIAMSLIELVKYLFSLPCVNSNHLAFLSQNICQDPVENFFLELKGSGEALVIILV